MANITVILHKTILLYICQIRSTLEIKKSNDNVQKIIFVGIHSHKNSNHLKVIFYSYDIWNYSNFKILLLLYLCLHQKTFLECPILLETFSLNKLHNWKLTSSKLLGQWSFYTICSCFLLKWPQKRMKCHTTNQIVTR